MISLLDTFLDSKCTLYAGLISPFQGVEKSERTIHAGRAVGELAFFFGMRHLGLSCPFWIAI